MAASTVAAIHPVVSRPCTLPSMNFPNSASPSIRSSLAVELNSARALHASPLRKSDFFSSLGFQSPSESSRILMAVPKKKTSRTKTKIRRAVWKAQGKVAAAKAYSLAKSVLTGRSNSFLYIDKTKKESDEDEGESEEGSEEAN